MGSMQVMWANLSRTWKSTTHWVQKGSLQILLIFLVPVAATAQSRSGQTNLSALFAEVGRMHNIDPDLLEAMAEVESGRDSLRVSPKGALGIMQLMPATATAFSVIDPFNPVSNVIGAADFLDYLRNRLANNLNLRGLPILLSAYNAGPGAVEKYGGVPPYAETHRYVRRVMELYANSLSAQLAGAPVLILGPKPYIVQLRAGSSATQAEPVLISVDRDDPVLNSLLMIRRKHGNFVAAIGTGTEPWIRRVTVPNHTDLPRR
jgi:hypothetical protein